MKRKRLEEVLDECLAAHLEGRRSIEESLSLYPSLRSDLEPLLRTAAKLADKLQTPSPSPHVLASGRQRFLESAQIRRRAAELVRDIPISRRMAAGWRRSQWGLAAAVGVAVFVAIAFSASALNSRSPGPDPQAQVILDDSPPAVAELRQAQEEVRVQAAEGGSVSPRMIRDLVATTTELEAQVRDFDSLNSNSQRELALALGYQYLLLQFVLETQSSDISPQASMALGVTSQLADSWGVDLPEPTPHASATAAPTPSALPGGTPSSTPSTPSTAPPTSPSPISPAPSPTEVLTPEIP